MINNVTLTGRITKDLEKHETGKGTSVVNFSLAVDRRFKGSNGNREADFIGIQAWGMTADLLCKYCGKGSLIGIEGRIQTRNYENNQGQQGGYQQSNGYQNDNYQQTFDSALPFDDSADDVPF